MPNMNAAKKAFKMQSSINRAAKSGRGVHNAETELHGLSNGTLGLSQVRHAKVGDVQKTMEGRAAREELHGLATGTHGIADMRYASIGDVQKTMGPLTSAREGLAGALKGASKRKSAVSAGPASQANLSPQESYLAKKAANKERGRQNAKDIGRQRVADAKARLANPGDVHDGNAISQGLRREKDEAIVKRGEAAERRSARGATVNNPTASGRGTTTPTTKGTASNSPKDSGRFTLDPGGAATANLTGQITGTAKMMGDNIAEHVGAKYGGNYGAFLGKSALQGAVWGGAIGGTVSASQGGDFWAGAKEGAFKGAVGMAGWNTLRAGTKTKGMFDVGTMSHNAKQMWNHHSVSKPVTAITRTAPTMQVANQMVSK